MFSTSARSHVASRRSILSIFVASALLAAACASGTTSDGDTTSTTDRSVGSQSTTTEPNTVLMEPTEAIFVVRAVAASVRTGDSPVTLELVGVEHIITWFDDLNAGRSDTTTWVRNWDDWSEESSPPQAVIVSADEGSHPLAVTLENPVWDETARTLDFQLESVTSLNPRLSPLAEETVLHDLDWTSITLYLVSETDNRPPPVSTPQTTSTTSLPDSSSPSTSSSSTTTTSPGPSTTGDPNTTVTTSPSTTTPPILTTTTSLPPPPSTTSPGPANFSISPLDIIFPNTGGTVIITITNLGSSPGSWSANSPVDQGIQLSPTSGFLFPGSTTQMAVSYDGVGGPAGDFSTTFNIITTSKTFTIRATVRQ